MSLFAKPHPLVPEQVARLDLSDMTQMPASGSSFSVHESSPAIAPANLMLAPEPAPPSMLGPRFAPLATGTDLNQPPRDTWSVQGWEPYRLFPIERPTHYSNAQPDFIARAEHLKALFQLPYSQSPVSLTVHRVGGTLMLDDATPVATAVGNLQRKLGVKGAPPGFAGLLDPPCAPNPNTNNSIAHETGLHQAAQMQQQLEAKLLYHAFSAEAGMQHSEAAGAAPCKHALLCAADAASAGDWEHDQSKAGAAFGADHSGRPSRSASETSLASDPTQPSHPPAMTGRALALWGGGGGGGGGCGGDPVPPCWEERGGAQERNFPAPDGACEARPPARTWAATVALPPPTTDSSNSNSAGFNATKIDPLNTHHAGSAVPNAATTTAAAAALAVPPGACQMRTPLRAAMASLQAHQQPSRLRAPPPAHSGMVVASTNQFAALADCSVSSSGSATSHTSASLSGPQLAMVPVLGRSAASLMDQVGRWVSLEGRGETARPLSASDARTSSDTSEHVDQSDLALDSESDRLSDLYEHDPGSDAGDNVGKLKEEHESGASSHHQYWEGMDQSHLFEWNVADFKLLVESDLVLFRNRASKPVSLKLHDMDEPVTTLTCLSTWLDNLFAQVEDLAICYHRNGCVAGYDLMKTEDLPKMCHPQFAPEKVMKYAGHVLSFLSENCTTDAATYWLFREPQSDVLQLYDVSGMLDAVRQEHHGAQPADGVSSSQRVSSLQGSPLSHGATCRALDAGDAPLALTLAGEEGVWEGSPPAARETGRVQPLNRMGKLCFSLANLIPEDQAEMQQERLHLMQRAAELLCPEQDPLFYTQAHERAADVLLQHKGVCAALQPRASPSMDTTPLPAVPRLPAPHAQAAKETPKTADGLETHSVQDQTEGRTSVVLNNKLAPSCLCTGGEIESVGNDNLHEAAKHLCLASAVLHAPPEHFGMGREILATEAASRVHSKLARVFVELAHRAYLEGQLGKALGCAQQAIEWCPSASAPWALLGDVHAALRNSLSQHELETALADWHNTKDQLLCHARRKVLGNLEPIEYDDDASAHDVPAALKLKSAIQEGPAPASAEDRGRLHLEASTSCYNRALRLVKTHEGEPGRRATREKCPLSKTSNKSGKGKKLAGPATGSEGGNQELRLSSGKILSGLRLSNWVDGVRTVQRRLGSLYNEMAQRLLGAALPADSAKVECMYEAAAMFKLALSAFEAAEDAANTSLVLSNLAKVSRQCAAVPLPQVEAGPKGKSPLQHFKEAEQMCRAATEVLGRREIQPWLWNVAQMELATCQLAEGVYRLENESLACIELHVTAIAAGSDAEFYAKEKNRATAISLLMSALQSFQVVGNVAASQLAVAHYHLGHALCKNVLEGDAQGAGDCLDASRGRRRPAKVTLPIRHLEKSLAFFTATEFPIDFIRTSLQLARLHEGVSPPSLERALAHAASTGLAFLSLNLVEDKQSSHDAPSIECQNKSKYDVETLENLCREVEVTVGRIVRELIRTSGSNSARGVAYKDLYRIILQGPQADAAELGARLIHIAQKGADERLF